MAPSLSTSFVAGLGLFAALESAAINVRPKDSLYGSLHPKVASPAPGPPKPGVWPGGKIPYVLDHLPSWLSGKLRRAMRVFELRTCIRFVAKDDSHDTWARYTKKDDDYQCLVPHGWPGPNKGPANVTFDLLNDPLDIPQLLNGGLKQCAGGGKPLAAVRLLIGPANVVQGASTRVTLGVKEKDYQAVNTDYHCPPMPGKGQWPDCISAGVPTNKEYSSFRFIVDPHTVMWMRTKEYDTVRVVQICLPRGGNPHSWGEVSLGAGKGGAANEYFVDRVPRCKDGGGRHSSRYELHFCKDKKDCMSCIGSEDGRRVCPVDGGGNKIDSKAVDVVDHVPWVCHALV